eukprot:5238989-Amphidinium_carterae.2
MVMAGMDGIDEELETLTNSCRPDQLRSQQQSTEIEDPVQSWQHSLDTWCPQAFTMLVSCLSAARDDHEKCLDMLLEEQAVLERTFIMGTVYPVPRHRIRYRSM